MDLIAIGQRLGLIPQQLHVPAQRDLSVIRNVPGEPELIVVSAADLPDPVAAQERDWLAELVEELLFSDDLPEWLRIGNHDSGPRTTSDGPASLERAVAHPGRTAEPFAGATVTATEIV